MEYPANELGFEAGGQTDRSLGLLSWISDVEDLTGDAVPYAFKTTDGATRSIDAGVMGYLAHTSLPTIDLICRSDGFVVAVRRHQPVAARVKGEFTVADLCSRGQGPAMARLIEAVANGDERLTYGALAKHLNSVLGFSNVTHHHVGDVIEAMMGRIHAVAPDAPLINVMVMRKDAQQPGIGADAFLKRRYNLATIQTIERPGLVRRALNEIKAFQGWDALYEEIYGAPLSQSLSRLDQFDDDGQGDNPKYSRQFGNCESEEHKALKAYVRDNPHELRLGLTDPKTAIERPLHSGDRMDVEIIDGRRWIAVEVKSIKSGDEDLRRGLFQCVKYKAVMEAQSGLSVAADCDALLVVERLLPPELQKTAKKLGVRHLVLRVN